jgi:hypothetical protein
MPKNFMTQSDDKTRWILAYVLFAVSEVLAAFHSYQSIGRSAIGYLSYGLIFVALIPIFSARATLSIYRKNPTIQTDSTLLLDLSFRLWSLVIASYTLFLFALIVTSPNR